MTFSSLSKLVATSVAIPALAFAVIAPAPTVSAQLQAGDSGVVIQPANEWVTGDSMTRKNFYVEVEPGQSITRSITVSNLGNEESRVLLSPEDRVQNIEQFTFTDSQELQEVGTWMSLEATDIKVGSQKSVTTDFTITVPAGTPAGEYAGVIAMEEAALEEDTNGSGFQLRARIGTRVYITVPSGELNHGVNFETFEFVTPGSNSYDQYIKGYYRQDPIRVHMNWKYQNTGNVFTKMKGNLTISTPDGEVTTDFDRDLNTFDTPIELAGFPTNARWTPGQYKAVFEFENSPVSLSNREANLNNVSPTQKVETEITMTQDMIDQIVTDFEALQSERPEVNPAPVNPNGDQNTIQDAVNEDTDQEDEDKTDMTALYVIAGIGGVIILALIGVIIFLMKKQKKEESEDISEKKEPSKK